MNTLHKHTNENTSYLCSFPDSLCWKTDITVAYMWRVSWEQWARGNDILPNVKYGSAVLSRSSSTDILPGRSVRTNNISRDSPPATFPEPPPVKLNSFSLSTGRVETVTDLTSHGLSVSVSFSRSSSCTAPFRFPPAATDPNKNSPRRRNSLGIRVAITFSTRSSSALSVELIRCWLVYTAVFCTGDTAVQEAAVQVKAVDRSNIPPSVSVLYHYKS